MTHPAIRMARELKRRQQLRHKLTGLKLRVSQILNKEFDYLTGFEVDLLSDFDKSLDKLLFPKSKDRLK